VAKLAELQREVNGLAPQSKPKHGADAYTVSTWLDRWYRRVFLARRSRNDENEPLSRSHVRRTLYAVEALKAGLGTHSLFSLTAEHVEDMLAYRATVKVDRKVWSRATCRNVRNVLGDALSTACTRGYAPQLNVGYEAKLPHEAAAAEKRYALDAQTADKLYRAARDDGAGVALVAALQLTTGMRPGEALALRWRDVDLSKSTLIVRKAKTNTGVRTITLSRAASAVLSQRAFAAGADKRDAAQLVFPGLRGQLAPSTLCDKLEALCDQLSITVGPERRVLHPHELRHTAGSLLIDGGMRIDRVADMLGAKIETILRVYRHQLENLVGASAHELLDAIFGKSAAA